MKLHRYFSIKNHSHQNKTYLCHDRHLLSNFWASQTCVLASASTQFRLLWLATWHWLYWCDVVWLLSWYHITSLKLCFKRLYECVLCYWGVHNIRRHQINYKEVYRALSIGINEHKVLDTFHNTYGLSCEFATVGFFITNRAGKRRHKMSWTFSWTFSCY